MSKVSTNSSGSVIFKAGDNKLVVKNAADKVVTYIDADGSTKTFGQASTNPKLITLTEGNDTYSNTVEGVTINALGGDDSIYSYGNDSVTIDGGAGADIFALKPTVANVISDYDSEDKISLLSGAAAMKISESRPVGCNVTLPRRIKPSRTLKAASKNFLRTAPTT